VQLAPSPDATWIAAGCNDNTVRLWRRATGQARRRPRRVVRRVANCTADAAHSRSRQSGMPPDQRQPPKANLLRPEAARVAPIVPKPTPELGRRAGAAVNLHLLGQPKTFLAAVARAGAAVRRLLLEDHGPLLGQLEPLPRHRRLQPGAPRPPWLLVDRVVQTTRTLVFSYCPSRRTPRTATQNTPQALERVAARRPLLQLTTCNLQLTTCNCKL
jgi:hypothetical protein